VIGIDTNVLVRYITQDDPAQARKATNVIERECTDGNRGFVSVVVLLEVVWVVESCYAASRDDVATILRRILESRQLAVQDAEPVWQALSAFERTNSDFADCLVAALATASGCTKVVTFDRKATRVGMTLL
jgi:predicted nucleic-acid-binding protein